MGSSAVKEAVNSLGRYFGIRAADEYLNSILSSASKTTFPVGDDKTDPKTASRARLLNAITGGGDTSIPTIESILNFCAEGGAKTKDKDGKETKGSIELKTFAEDICVTPNDDGAFKKDKMPLNKLSVETTKGTCEDQGMIKPGNGEFYTLNDLREKVEGAGEGSVGDTKVGVIQVFPAAGNVANSDTDVASLFLSAIPNIEFSKAVPFVDILTLVNSVDDPKKTRSFSIGRYLLGEDVSGQSADIQSMMNAEDISNNRNLTEEIKDDDGKPIGQLRTAATMEIFTLPQTMLPLEGASSLGDPFRSFLSLENLGIQVQPSGNGMFSFKTADMALTLHDKTRLGDIAELLVPDQRANVQFVMTYGWSHPDGTSSLSHGTGRKSDANDNRFGLLMDAMKVTETFQVVNSDFSFEENGSVSISLKLALLGSSDLSSLDITLQEVVDVVEKFSSVIKSINKALKTLGENADSVGEKIDVPKYVMAATNMDSARSMSTKDAEKLLKWAKGGGKKKDPQLNEIDKAVKELIGAKGGKGVKKQLATSKEAAINKLIARLKSTPDPWLRPVGTYNATIKGLGKYKSARKKALGRKKQNTVSLGKLMSFFVAESIRANQQFSEVQLVFHAFNSSASYLFDCNIAQFPINISDLDTIMKKRFNSLGRMSLEGFVNMLQTYFLSDDAAYGYGFGAAYGKRGTKEKLAQRTLTSVAKGAGKMQTFRGGILKTAYGGDSIVLFNKPSLTIKLQSAPSRNKVHEGGDCVLSPDKPILRLQIYDSSCDTTQQLNEMFEGFASTGLTSKMKRDGSGASKVGKTYRGARHDEIISNQMSILEDELDLIKKVEVDKKLIDENANKMKITFEELKEYAKDMYQVKPAAYKKLKASIMELCPTLIWGAATSGILSAKLKTQNDAGVMNSALSSPSKPTENQEQGVDGVPMQIMPTALDLELLGCPYISFGQKYFLDFGTNTNADNFYTVIGISHTITPGEFKTSAQLVNNQAFGSYVDPAESIKKLAVQVHLAKKKKKK
jgi:hypothetical protein